MLNIEKDIGDVYLSCIVEGKQPAPDNSNITNSRVDENLLKQVYDKCCSFLFEKEIRLTPEAIRGDIQQFRYDSGVLYANMDTTFLKIVAQKKVPFSEGFLQVYSDKEPLFKNGLVNFERVEISYKIPGSKEIENLVFNA